MPHYFLINFRTTDLKSVYRPPARARRLVSLLPIARTPGVPPPRQPFLRGRYYQHSLPAYAPILRRPQL